MGQKWRFKAITAKSEENRLGLKFHFTSSRVSQKHVGGVQVPHIDTPYSRSQNRPILRFSYSPSPSLDLP